MQQDPSSPQPLASQPEKNMSASLTLLNSPRIRYLTGAMMYFAQGIPYGLLSIAIPAWLVTKGVSAADIGSYLAVVVLPWVFKLLTGPLMACRLT